MNFGTKGCMYNCGDECTGECIKVETKTKMNKDGKVNLTKTTEEILQWHAIVFAEFVSNDPVFDDFWSMSKEHQENIYQQYLKSFQ